MSKNVIVNIIESQRRVCVVFLAILIVNLFALPTKSQGKLTEELSITPFNELLQKPVAISPELNNIHPRLFFTAQDLPKIGLDKNFNFYFRSRQKFNRNPVVRCLK